MDYFPALLRKDEDSDIGVEFPDFPGCVTATDSFGNVMQLATEALGLHVAGMIDDGEAIPEPSSLESVIESAAAKGAAAILVPLAAQRSKAVRINVTIDERLLGELDALAKQQGTNRSAFLAAAARAQLEREDGDDVAA